MNKTEFERDIVFDYENNSATELLKEEGIDVDEYITVRLLCDDVRVINDVLFFLNQLKNKTEDDLDREYNGGKNEDVFKSFFCSVVLAHYTPPTIYQNDYDSPPDYFDLRVNELEFDFSNRINEKLGDYLEFKITEILNQNFTIDGTEKNKKRKQVC